MQHPAATTGPRAPGGRRGPEALRRRGAPARCASGGDPLHDHRRGRRGARRGPAAADPGRDRRARPLGSGADRVHVRDHRRAASSASLAALPPRSAHPGRALARRRRRRTRLVHDRDRLVEVGPQRVRRAMALRRGGVDRRPALRSRSTPRPDRERGRQRPLPGTDRVPGPCEAGRATATAVAAANGLGRGGAQSGSDRGLVRGHRARDLRRLRPDRDRAPGGQPWRRRDPRRLDGNGAARHRAAGRGRRARGPSRELPDILFALPRWRAVQRRVVADGGRGARGPGRLSVVRGPRRRPDHVGRLPDRPVRGRVGAAHPPRCRRGRRGRRPGRGARIGRPGDRRPARWRALGAARPGAAGARQDDKYPRVVEFADELPKTASGKIKRAELRAGQARSPAS